MLGGVFSLSFPALRDWLLNCDSRRRREGPDASSPIADNIVRATAGRFSLTWRKDLLWIAGFDVTCWLFGVIAFTGGESPRWRGGDNSIPSCTWSGGDQGTIWPYTHHLLRAIFVLSWITYQRNCLCRAHHCCSSYDRCAIVTRAVFLGFLLLELIVDTILMFVWASFHPSSSHQTAHVPFPTGYISLPIYTPPCNGERISAFIWMSFLMWIMSLLYVRRIVSDLQLCGNMMRERHCCRRFRLVEDPVNAHALQWCCSVCYSSDTDADDEEKAPAMRASHDEEDEETREEPDPNTATVV